MNQNKPFTSAQIDWMKENHDPNESIGNFKDRFNLFFSENRSYAAIKQKMRKLSLKKEGASYSKEQDLWLSKNAPNLSVKETAIKFNFVFAESRSAGALKVRCNKLLNVVHKNIKTGKYKPIGSEITLKNGFVYVKISDYHSGNASFYRNWKRKHLIVWEANRGKVPKGYTIVFLDRNHSNCSIDNLYIVDGRVLREMVKKKWFSENSEVTLAAIKWCELFYAIKQVESQ